MIPTTFDRADMFSKLVDEILDQIVKNKLKLNQDIEIVSIEDGKEISVGKKRQQLLEMTKGDFVVGIDSDDWIDADYIEDIIYALRLNPGTDHVGFLEHCTIDGEESMSIFSIRHFQWAENTDGYDHIRCANPKSVIRRTKALQVGYEDLRYGEDRIFSEKVTPLLESEVFINKPLYYYRHISSDHNTRYGIKD